MNTDSHSMKLLLLLAGVLSLTVPSSAHMGSVAVADGKPVVTKVMTYVNKDISPIDCQAFK